MGSDERFTVRYWGVRGSIPAPGAATVRYGGNTSCVEVRCGQRLLIIDAGTGLRPLGEALVTAGGPVRATLFFTHVHWDHIQGFPFFHPLYHPGTHLELVAPTLTGTDLRKVLGQQMSYPTFPVELGQVGASLTFTAIEPGSSVDLGDGIVVDTRPLNHPGGSLGLRVSYAGKSFVHISDTEHYPDRFDENVLELCRGADLVDYDASFNEAEYAGNPPPSKVGWGHSTWEHGVLVAREAGIGTLSLFHHDYAHDDGHLDAVHALARREYPNTIMAVEGLEVDLLNGTFGHPGSPSSNP